MKRSSPRNKPGYNPKIRGLGDEERPEKETEKEQPVKSEDQESLVFRKSSEITQGT